MFCASKSLLVGTSHGRRTYRFGSDPGLNVLLYKIWALEFLGLLDQAERVGNQLSVDLGSQGHAQTVAECALWARVWPEFLSGDLEACERHAVELIDYCAEKKVEQFRLFGTVHHACARAMRQPTRENIVTIRTAIDESHRSGARFMDSVYSRTWLATAGSLGRMKIARLRALGGCAAI